MKLLMTQNILSFWMPGVPHTLASAVTSDHSDIGARSAVSGMRNNISSGARVGVKLTQIHFTLSNCLHTIAAAGIGWYKSEFNFQLEDQLHCCMY